jgi:hypothetical protein
MGGLTNPNPGPLTVDDQTEIEFWSGVLEEHQNRQMLQISRESLSRLLRIARGVKSTLENAHG